MNNINQQIIDLRKETELSRKAFAEHFGIPLRTIEDWEAERRTPPEYVPRLIKYQIEFEKLANKHAKTVVSEIETHENENLQGKIGS